MSSDDYGDITPILEKLFGAQADAKVPEFLKAPIDFRIHPQDVKPADVTNRERHEFEEFMAPYGELLELFQPEACRDSDFIGFNLVFMQHVSNPRLLSPFEVLRGRGVEIVARSGDAGVSTRPDSHSVVLSVPAEPDMLARVAVVLAKYGIIPENMMTSRYGAGSMNMVIEITGEDVTREAAEKFVAALQQKLLMAHENATRLYSRPASKRLGTGDSFPAAGVA